MKRRWKYAKRNWEQKNSENRLAKLKIIRSQMDTLASLKRAVESEILKIAQAYMPQINLPLTVPGIKEPLTAILIIAEIGVDMSVFDTAKHLTSWAGLTPQNNESADKKKTTRIGKAGAYIKPLLVQIAQAASRSSLYPEVKGKHLSLKKRRDSKKGQSPLPEGCWPPCITCFSMAKPTTLTAIANESA